MKIGIDARLYGSQNKGLGRYVKEMTDRIVAQDEKNDYVVFLRKDNFEMFNPKNPRVKKVLADIRWYTLAEQIILPFFIWREKLDFIHFMHFNVPILTPNKSVLTIHDLILTKFPTTRATTLGPFLYKIKNFAYKLVIRTAIKRAEKIIAVCKYTKKDIIEHFKANPDKIEVIYEGLTELSDKKITVEEQKKILKKYKTTKPFLLYVGNAYPHKNLESLIEVMPDILAEKKDLCLVLVGGDDYFYKRLKDLAREKKLFGASDDKVIFPGFVPDEELPAFFGGAEIYVFPSFFEGFGLPALEAMSHGCPVVSSSATCLPEVLGEAAEFFNPADKEDMKEKIFELLDDDKKRKELIKKGFEQVKKYNWDKAAEQVREVYSKLFA